MGTNYYMCHPDKQFIQDMVGSDCEELRVGRKNYWAIHLCKKSGGWCPLFESHLALYASVEELLELLECSRDGWIIADEYGNKIKYIDFERLIDSWKNLSMAQRHADYNFPGYFTDSDGFEFTSSPFS